MGFSRSVLLVGDLPDLSGALAGLPCRLIPAENLDSALNNLSSSKTDLVLCDYPSLDPIRASNAQVPVIVLGQALPNQEVLAAMEKAFAYLLPPFEPEHIKDLVREAFENPDQPDSIQIESRKPNFISLRLRCSFATADRLMRFAVQVKSDLPEEERRQAAIAFREMLLNAIEHGGGLNPDQWVRVCRVRSKRAVFYHIQDPGEGFSRVDLKHAAVSNPIDAPDHHVKYRQEMGLRSGGFGILLAQNLVDEIIYNESGNAVVLIKYLD
jgi:anti-sigma regulatory factor (Ser/Thr protein kinase)